MVGLLSDLFGTSDASPDTVRGINSTPPGSGFGETAGPLLSAIGMSLLTSTRQNPLGNLPTFLQQANLQRDKQDQRNALVLALKQAGFSDDQAKALSINPDAAKIAIAGQATARGQAADRAALGVLGGSGATGTTGTAPPAPAGPAAGASLNGNGVDGFVGAVVSQESDGNPNARNPNSTATGLGQFTERTWQGLMRSRPDLGLTPDGRTNPDQSRKAIRALAEENAPQLTGAGHEASPANLYIGHFLGGAGGVRFLNGLRNNPNALASSYADPSAVAANREVFFNRDGTPRTAQQVYDLQTRKFQGGGVTRMADASGSVPAGVGDGTAIQTEGGPVAFTPSGGPGAASRPPVQVAENEADVQRLERGMSPAARGAGSADMPAPGSQNAQFQIPGAASAGDAPTVFNDRVTAMQALGRINQALQTPGITDDTRKVLESRRQEAIAILKPTDTQQRLIDAGLRPGTPEFQEAARRLAFGDKDKDPTETVAGRQALAEQYGFRKGTPEYVNWVLGKKLPRDEEPKPLSVADRSAILKADEAVESARGVIGNLREALDLSKKAYDGPTASYRGSVTGLFGSEAGQATTQFDNLITTTTLGQLKQIFGGNPTEGERKILLEVQGASSQPQAVREAIIRRAMSAAERKLQVMQERADELRGGTYYQPGGGRAGNGARGQASTPAFSQEELLAEARRRGLAQ